MTVPGWNPAKELSRRERMLLKRRTKKLFGFLRQHSARPGRSGGPRRTLLGSGHGGAEQREDRTALIRFLLRCAYPTARLRCSREPAASPAARRLSSL